jgi:hypothetical protein
VNTRQKLALEKHCRLAFETLHPSLFYMTPVYSIVLSVNSGYE